jgi:hypothetical protein
MRPARQALPPTYIRDAHGVLYERIPPRPAENFGHSDPSPRSLVRTRPSSPQFSQQDHRQYLDAGDGTILPSIESADPATTYREHREPAKYTFGGHGADIDRVANYDPRQPNLVEQASITEPDYKRRRIDVPRSTGQSFEHGSSLRERAAMPVMEGHRYAQHYISNDTRGVRHASPNAVSPWPSIPEGRYRGYNTVHTTTTRSAVPNRQELDHRVADRADRTSRVYEPLPLLREQAMHEPSDRRALYHDENTSQGLNGAKAHHYYPSESVRYEAPGVHPHQAAMPYDRVPASVSRSYVPYHG